MKSAKATPTAGDSPPAPAAAPIRFAAAISSASPTASLSPSGRSSGPERLELRLDRLGPRPRPRVPARHPASVGSGRVASASARAASSWRAPRRSRPPLAGPRPARLAARRRASRRGSASGADTALQRVPQRPRRRLRVVGLGDRAHDHDPRRAALEHLVHVAGVEPADREPGLAPPCSPRARRSAGPRRGGPAWSASRAPGRPRGSRRRRPRRRPRPGRARASSGRRSGPRPTAARACAGDSSSCPTCTPSAPHASTRSGRSLRMKSASWPVNARAAATIPSSSSVLSRSWIRSTPPRTAAAIQSRGSAGQTRYRRAVARRSRGVTHQGIPCAAQHGSPLSG